MIFDPKTFEEEVLKLLSKFNKTAVGCPVPIVISTIVEMLNNSIQLLPAEDQVTTLTDIYGVLMRLSMERLSNCNITKDHKLH